jgi:hypothetical protein
VPGVEAVGASNNIPLGGGGGGANVLIEGQPAAPGEEPGIYYTGVTADWLRALGIRPTAGRVLTEGEAGSRSAVALVNQTRSGAASA